MKNLKQIELFERPIVSTDSRRRKRTNKLRKLGQAFVRCGQVGAFDDQFFYYLDGEDPDMRIELEETILMFDKQNKEWGIYKDEGIKF